MAKYSPHFTIYRYLSPLWMFMGKWSLKWEPQLQIGSQQLYL
jgi:hypothetical protein